MRSNTKITPKSALRLGTFGLAVTTVLAIVAGAVPAGASVAGDAGTSAVACSYSFNSTPTSYTSVFVCGGNDVAVTLNPAVVNESYVYGDVWRCTYNAGWTCGEARFDQVVPAADVTIDPLLSSAAIHTAVGCGRIDLNFTATSNPTVGTWSFSAVTPNGASLNGGLFGQVFAERDAVSNGIACGAVVTNGSGWIERGIGLGTWFDTAN